MTDAKSSAPRTMLEKIWDEHIVYAPDSGPAILYVDLHLVHEVTSPQAFEGLRINGRPIRRPERTIATPDHNVPTSDRSLPIADPISRKQIETLRANCAEFGVTLFDIGDVRQGIVHVIGPENGYTQPGMTIVCGDSHTATHGAFGALAFGIGTSEVEHVLATQTLRQFKPKTFELRVDGELPQGVTAKDMILYLIGQIGTAGGTGYVLGVHRRLRSRVVDGRTDDRLQHVDRSGRPGRDDRTRSNHVRLPARPARSTRPILMRPSSVGSNCRPMKGASYDVSNSYRGGDIEPQVTWGTNPGQVRSINDCVPDPADFDDATEQKSTKDALEYMGLTAKVPIHDISIERVFIGSCTNARIEDLRAAAAVVKGHHVSSNVNAMVVPGSGQVKLQAEKEGIDQVFKEAGFDWREAGCSMCLAMNPDKLAPGERCASTSNRNFEGRQGKGGRTHLVSPAMAAAAAVKGHFVDIREWDYKNA